MHNEYECNHPSDLAFKFPLDLCETRDPIVGRLRERPPVHLHVPATLWQMRNFPEFRIAGSISVFDVILGSGTRFANGGFFISGVRVFVRS